MLSNIRGWEWLIILVIVVLLFGAKRLPGLAKSVGESLRIFKSEVKSPEQEEAEKQPAAKQTADRDE